MNRNEYNEEIFCAALILKIQRNQYHLSDDLITQIALVQVALRIDPDRIEATEVDALVDRLRELVVESGHKTDDDLPPARRPFPGAGIPGAQLPDHGMLLFD